jgi:hypothetical protein
MMTRENVVELLARIQRDGQFNGRGNNDTGEVLKEFDALKLHADERDSLREILLQRAREAAQAAYQIELLTEQKLLAPRGGPHPAELVLGDILDSLETDELGGHIPGIIADYWKAKDQA